MEEPFYLMVIKIQLLQRVISTVFFCITTILKKKKIEKFLDRKICMRRERNLYTSGGHLFFTELDSIRHSFRQINFKGILKVT